MIVRAVDWNDPDAIALRAAQEAEVAAMYGTADNEPGPAPTASDMLAFFVAYGEGGEPTGCGGIRRLDAAHGEIKRMFVDPAHRGSGVSTALLGAMEDFARGLGWQRLVLETGLLQQAAVRLYEREGYTPIARYGYYADSADSVCFEKVLLG